MENEAIRRRLREYVEGCRTPFTTIGRDAELGEPSRYIISRFLRGFSLNDESLKKIDLYLSSKGF